MAKRRRTDVALSLSDIAFSAPTNATLGSGSTKVLDANDAAVYRLITNDSLTKIYLGLDNATAVKLKGITLAPGAAYEMVEGFNMSKGQINAIPASGSGQIVAVQEGT